MAMTANNAAKGRKSDVRCSIRNKTTDTAITIRVLLVARGLKRSKILYRIIPAKTPTPVPRIMEMETPASSQAMFTCSPL